MKAGKILKYFAPSILVYIFYKLLSLFATCIEYADYRYYSDPLNTCKNVYFDIAAYHWFVVFAVLPFSMYLYEITKTKSVKNKSMAALNILLFNFIAFLIVFLLIFRQVIDFPFWAYYI